MLSSYSSLFLHPLLIISFFLFPFSFYQRFFLFFLKGFFLDLLYNLDNLDRSMILQKSHLHIAVINIVMISMQNKILLNSTIYAKKNGTLWKKVDSLWQNQCKFIPQTSLISLVFCMTLPRLHDRLHPPRHWFIQLVEVVAHDASPDLFITPVSYLSQQHLKTKRKSWLDE